MECPKVLLPASANASTISLGAASLWIV